jgi:hypothetical protein
MCIYIYGASKKFGEWYQKTKWAKAPGVKFEFGSLPKRTNAPE